jgi:hypothetical protein
MVIPLEWLLFCLSHDERAGRLLERLPADVGDMLPKY